MPKRGKTKRKLKPKPKPKPKGRHKPNPEAPPKKKRPGIKAYIPKHRKHRTHPDVTGWLLQHPNVAGAIKWQSQPASMSNAYAPPTDSDKVSWSNWTPSQKAELNQACLKTYFWFGGGAHQVQMDPNGLTDQPVNVQPDVAKDDVTALEDVSPAYMWKLYLAHVGFSLAAELRGQLPWSITGYSEESLRYLFDSTTMAWNIFGSHYGMGTYNVNLPVKRADNRPKTAFAPPKWTYPFLKQTGLVGTTRLETIGKVLEWMRQNLAHFYGPDTYGNCFAVWQYRGYPPLSKIVNGTIDSNNPNDGLQHWTAGCHGSVGFLNAVLRVVNIPVQPIWVCGHELVYFMTENLYLDHGDDPYNANVKNSTSPILSLLIDEATYKAWFTSDLTVNITNALSPACANIGRRAAEFQ